MIPAQVLIQKIRALEQEAMKAIKAENLSKSLQLTAQVNILVEILQEQAI